MVQDYYKILELPPSATAAEIKAAFRRLALAWHPDRNPGNRHALAAFTLIKEAYETLSDKTLKEEYLWRRWLKKAEARTPDHATHTPETILAEFLSYAHMVQQLDAFRADRKAISENICRLLHHEHIATLNRFEDRAINHQIILLALQINAAATPGTQKRVLATLKEIYSEPQSAYFILAAEKQYRQEAMINTLKPWLVLLVVLLFCLLIWLTGQRR